MTHATGPGLGVVLGLLAAAAAYRWTRVSRRVRVAAALVLVISGAALGSAAVRSTIPFEKLAPAAGELAARAVRFDLAAAIVGALGGVCLIAGRPGLAGTAGLAVLALARRCFVATAAWSSALWGQAVVDARVLVDVALDVAVALILLAGAMVARGASGAAATGG
ncbi:hypothetical protein [Nannocystis punicea]|uniref:Uncharacterized protein n=1 Tax=Nannocystis punicea TaxID=2995304 RepID=A0ABY7GXW3_9BACT|nr:hypothetical protein [Nannocystis poenicansa]WAS91735.1 hypothetical protein O0S08_36600 [Nannocystis poenicansa]